MRRLLVFLVISAVFFSVPFSSAQDGELSRDVKAAFLLNFAKFVQWPDSAFPNRTAPFTFCIVGDPLQGALDSTIRGETVASRPLVIRHINNDDNARGCHVLYLGQREPDPSLLGTPVLTVGDSSGFIQSGGIIRFIESARRIRFEINPEAAQRAQLQISSRLLRLADIVRASR